jgi:hypothetical protein
MLIGKALPPCMSKLVGDFYHPSYFSSEQFFTGEYISEIHSSLKQLRIGSERTMRSKRCF